MNAQLYFGSKVNLYSEETLETYIKIEIKDDFNWPVCSDGQNVVLIMRRSWVRALYRPVDQNFEGRIFFQKEKGRLYSGSEVNIP